MTHISRISKELIGIENRLYDEKTDGHGQTDGMDGRTDGRMDGWTDGRMGVGCTHAKKWSGSSRGLVMDIKGGGGA
jgi:hypothetical protein